MKLQKVLVPTDFSDAANKALEQSVTLAFGEGARIRVLHRLASPVPILPSAPYPGVAHWQELGTLLEEYMTQTKEAATSELEKLAREAGADVSIETSLVERLDTDEAITSAAEEWGADLIAMGTHGRTGLDKLVMGSMASKVLHHTDTPVMLVRAATRLYDGHRGARILVPVDFSDYSHRALGLARTLAEKFESRLHLMHVVELEQTPLEPAGLTSRFESDPELKGKYEDALKDMLADSDGEASVVEGSVAGEILWWREKLGADLVVLGSRGLRGIKHVLVGSVAEKVARFSEAPVIIVK